MQGRAWKGKCAQGTNICVYVPLQASVFPRAGVVEGSPIWRMSQRSALHIASSKGLKSTVAKLLSLGADAALKDSVRART